MSVNSFEFIMPRIVSFGAGIVEKLPGYIKNFDASKVLVITDRWISGTDFFNRIINLICLAKINISIFDEIDSEPTDIQVNKGLICVNEFKPELVVSVGGGSAIDCAKAICVLATNKGEINDYIGIEGVSKDKLPLIAVPTTAGTGSEVTRFTIITSVATNVKMLIASRKIIPEAALVDPELTYTMPKSVTACTGIDALTHAIESYISKKSNPISENLAISAIKRIGKFLLISYKNPEDEQAKEQVMLGSLEAGLSFGNSSVALVHGMARPIGAYFHIPHGMANALLLPFVMKYSYKSLPAKFAAIARALNENLADSSEAEASSEASDLVKDLCLELGIPKMKSAGIDESKFNEVVEQMSKDAIASGSPNNNPVVPQPSEIVELYKKIYGDDYESID
ncbi:MAG: iron-containing alcohol dehydrogenase [Actinobacteria bacterium]|nr:iron-containing alcohol dehydrogenase [Actinomycetota bacterium]